MEHPAAQRHLSVDYSNCRIRSCCGFICMHSWLHGHVCGHTNYGFIPHLSVYVCMVVQAVLCTSTPHPTHRILNQLKCKGTPSRFPGTKVKMARSEPLIQDADPNITKLTVQLGCRIRWSKKNMEHFNGGSNTEQVRILDGRWRSDFIWPAIFLFLSSGSDVQTLKTSKIFAKKRVKSSFLDDFVRQKNSCFKIRPFSRVNLPPLSFFCKKNKKICRYKTTQGWANLEKYCAYSADLNSEDLNSGNI